MRDASVAAAAGHAAPEVSSKATAAATCCWTSTARRSRPTGTSCPTWKRAAATETLAASFVCERGSSRLASSSTFARPLRLARSPGRFAFSWPGTRRGSRSGGGCEVPDGVGNNDPGDVPVARHEAEKASRPAAEPDRPRVLNAYPGESQSARLAARNRRRILRRRRLQCDVRPSATRESTASVGTPVRNSVHDRRRFALRHGIGRDTRANRTTPRASRLST